MSTCIKTRYFVTAACILMLLGLMTGCAPLRRPAEAPLPEQPAIPVPAPPEAPEIEEPADPRFRASMQLTEQARTLIDQERFDDAIRALERALALYPRNGQSYYYMAEAWLEKGTMSQAAEFNRLADMYLDGPAWDERIDAQRLEIEFGKNQ